MYISEYNLLLGSQSPRRAQLLTDLGFDFKVVSFPCEEIFPKEMPIEEVAGYLSELKAKAYPDLKPNELLLTADTIVCQGSEVIGKPRDEQEALFLLKKLRNSTHEVRTGISLRTAEGIQTLQDTALVEFGELSDEELQFYIKKFRPLDKAGSYGIQEWIGMIGVHRIQGSFYTIMGLPTHLVYRLLQPYYTIKS